MCLILFSLNHHPGYPLIIAANRDESYDRPTAPLGFWADAPLVAAGRDLDQGGTWLGITREGRWAALTNFRQAGSYRQSAPSRGRLVSNFLQDSTAPSLYVERLQRSAHLYNGFNLLVGDCSGVYYLSNREPVSRRVEHGIHGLSNHLLDTPWPKVRLGKQAMRELPDAAPAVLTDKLMHVLSVRCMPPDAVLPDTGVGLAGERVLSPTFIASERYGTRASTVVLLDAQGSVSIEERSYGPMGVPMGATPLTFELDAPAAALMADCPPKR